MQQQGPTHAERDVTPAARPPGATRSASAPHGASSLLTVQRTAGNRAVEAALREGAPIPAGTRGRMEESLGVNLGRVRVHADAAAAEVTRSLGADAFTLGRHVFVGAGQYRPGTPTGDRLLRHEAVHAVQQGFREVTRDSPPARIVDSPAHEHQARMTAAGLVSLRASSPVPPVSGVQRQASTGVAPPAGAPAPAVPLSPETAGPGAAGAPPVLFGFDMPPESPNVLFGGDMSLRAGTPYVSVSLPGHSLAEVTAYLYGEGEPPDSLRAENGALPEQLAPGRTLRFNRSHLTAAASAAFNQAITTGTVLRSYGLPKEGGSAMVYHAVVAGSQVDLTEDQFVAMLRGGARWVSFRAQEFKDSAAVLRDAQVSHVRESDFLIRWTSDKLGGVSLPDLSIYEEPMAAAQLVMMRVAAMQITPRSGPEIAALLPSLVTLNQQVNRARKAWHEYIEGTISGAGRGAEYAEITRNVAFATVAGLAGAVAAPAVFAASGTFLTGVGVTGTAATVISGTTALGGAALAGGFTRGTLDVAFAGAEADRPAWERFKGGFKSGSIQGAIGGAGALAAPATSAFISSRLFGVAPEALTGGSRVAVNLLTGAGIGVPSGAASTAIEQFGAVWSGQISIGQYFEHIGFGALGGGVMGGAFSFLPIEGLYRSGGQRLNPFSGEVTTPPWMFAAPGGPRIQEVEAPAAFHALRQEPSSPLPEGYRWIRLNNKWMTIRSYNTPEQPLQLVSYGPDPAGRFNYHLLTQGRLLGSSTTPRAPNDLYPSALRSDPIGAGDFVEPATGTNYGHGHIHDHADTLEGPEVANSTTDPLNYIPETRWWNENIRNHLVNKRIRPAGHGYREMAYYDLANPRFTANGAPIPEGVYFVETSQGQALNAWQVPFNYNYAAGPRGLAALPQFEINLSQLPPILRGSAPSPVVGVGGGAASELEPR